MPEIKQRPQLHASWIDPNAKEIVRILQKEGFLAYLVGGCVRDLLAGLPPKDFDIATNAEPNQVKRKVWGSYVIGRRFRLVLCKRNDQQYEVATFRRESTPEELEAQNNPEEQNEESENAAPVISGDNFFGTPEQDALRRDFTVNALFYDPIKDELIDYANGMVDVEARVLKMIGNSAKRISEDPIRSLRAIRFAHKLKFRMDPELRAAIQAHAADITRSVLPRRREEYLKFLRLKDQVPAWLELYDLGLMAVALPSLMPIFDDPARRDIFLNYLGKIEEICSDSSKTVEIYTPFILAYLRAMEGHPQKDKLLDILLKDEMMVFKSEQAVVMGSLEMTDHLFEIEAFKRRGLRRQQAFLKNEYLPLALRVAKVERFLSPQEYWFWQNQISNQQG